MGEQVTTVSNDLEAVEYAPKGSFDIVLMDIQMPMMTGYEATTILREMGFKRPINALTAHAMKGELERCIPASFDGYVAKPVNFTDLICEIPIRVAGNQEKTTPFVPRESQKLSKVPTSDQSHLGNLPPLSKQPIKSTFPPTDPIYDVVSIFAGNLPHHVANLRSELKAWNWIAMSTLAHQTRGIGSSIGFDIITRAAGGLEDALKGDTPDVNDLSAKVDELADLIKCISV